jgi:type IV secretion system protein VirB9
MKTGVNVLAMDFNFKITGDSPAWKPIRVYTDGIKTYIEFPDDKFAEGMPGLVELANDEGVFKDETTQLVNYLPMGPLFVADKKLQRFALMLGIDKKVIIEYTGRPK